MAPAAPGTDPGVRIIHVEDLKVLLDDAVKKGAEIGAKRVLKEFGLDPDEDSDGEGTKGIARDMREMRDWLAAWRSAKKTAWKTTVSLITKAVLVLLLLGAAWKLGIKLPGDAP